MARNAKPWFNREKKWWMVWLGGKQVKLAFGRPAKKEAEIRLKELQLQALKNPPSDADEQTIASVIEAYLKYETPNLAPNTLAIKRLYLQSLAENHGFRLVSEAKPIHLTEWLHQHPDWKSDWTISNVLKTVQRTFNWAVGEKVIRENPFKGKRHPEGDARRPLTREEFQALLRVPGRRSIHRPSPGARYRQVLVFLWRTGCRPCEVAGLRWSNVDLDHAVIVLKEHKTKKTQATPKPRVIPLDPVVVNLLRSIQKRGEGELVFLNHRKTAWHHNSLGLRIRRSRKEAGIPNDAKLYGLRHAFGTRAIIDGGVDVKTLSELMGHTTTRMTEHYLHLAGQGAHLAAAMQRINAGRRGA